MVKLIAQEAQLLQLKLLDTQAQDVDSIKLEQELSLAFEQAIKGVKEWLNQQRNV